MTKLFEYLREERVVPEGLSKETLLLAPIDFCSMVQRGYITWPLFFDADIDADRLIAALKVLLRKYPCLCGRFCPHENLRFVVEVFIKANKAIERFSRRFAQRKMTLVGFRLRN